MNRYAHTVAGLIALFGVGLLQAQTFSCRDNTGRIYQSSRPCGENGIIYYGPTERANNLNQSYIPKVSQAPEHIVYMSPRCASLHDAIRTAPVRGIKSAELSDMYREYSRDCSEDESKARRQLSEIRSDKHNAAISSEQAKMQEVNRSKLSAELCGELKRVIKNKKLRSDLTPGEQGDLARSEQNYKERCT
jgi:hypothetical protein